MRDFVLRFCDYYLRRPYGSLAVVLGVLVFAGWGAYQLEINSNQLDTLPPDLPHVMEARRVTEMIGGTGFTIITLKFSERSEADQIFEQAVQLSEWSRDEEAARLRARAQELYDRDLEQNRQMAERLKAASDQIVELLRQRDDVRYVRHKIDLDFIQTRILYYMKTPDLREAFRRIGLKRDELIERANPFFLDLGQPRYHLDLSDIRARYSKIGKKEIIDDYYVSPDRSMMVIVVKPSFSHDNIGRSERFLNDIASSMKELGLEEQGIEVGFTGSYPSYVQTYEALRESIYPTLALAIAGISLVLIFAFRRATLILALLLALGYAIVVTYGLTYLVFGELNLITSMFGGMLAGLGVDFGIHLIYRFRDDYALSGELIESLKAAIGHTGAAALYSAGSTTVAFSSLIISDFRGFSEFGIISAYGIIITAFTMFFLTPLLLVIAERFFPGAFKRHIREDRDHTREDRLEKRLPLPLISRVIVSVFVILMIAGLWLAPGVRWDHDVRNMIDNSIPANVLEEEMHLRYEVAGDPLAVAQESLDEARSLWEFMEPLPPEMSEHVAQVVSPYSFVPPAYQQRANYLLIQQFRQQNSVIRPGLLPPAYQPLYPVYERLVSQRPFGIEDVPEELIEEFRSQPESRYQGWLTFLYPEVSRLYDQKDLVALDDLVSHLRFPVVGRHTIMSMAYMRPWWENLTGRRFGGSTEAQAAQGFQISERDTGAVLDMANRATPGQLRTLSLSELMIETVIAGRPYDSLEALQAKTLKARAIGSTLLVAQFTQIVLRESWFLVVTTLGLVVVILWLSFRRVLSTLVALAPLFSGLVILAGWMALSEVRINYFNIAVLPIIVGYGINNGIFVFYRYLESGSIFHALYHTGMAGIASSLTSLAGWGAIATTSHPGLRSMGILASMGLVTMMVVTLVLLPAILVLLNHWIPDAIARLRARHSMAGPDSN